MNPVFWLMVVLWFFGLFGFLFVSPAAVVAYCISGIIAFAISVASY